MLGEDFFSGGNSIVLFLQFLNESLTLSRSKTWKELELIVTMVKLVYVIDINTDGIQHYNVYFLEDVHESSFIDVLLKRMQIKIESLILRNDGRPKVEYLVHRILFKSSQADSFFQNKWELFE